MVVKDYVEMCKQSEEIQSNWKVNDLDRFLFEDHDTDEAFLDCVPFYTNACACKTPEQKRNQQFYKNHCSWIPTQEDIQNLCMNIHLTYDYCGDTPTDFDSLLVFFFNWLDYGGKPSMGTESFNELWLVFYMETAYGKMWSEGLNKWVEFI